jgi:hypothetical protein
MQYVLPALGVLFVGLKLTAHITWSWWLVLAPFYVPLVFAIIALFAIIAAGLKK